MHRYTIDEAYFDELLARRAAAIDTIRASHPGLVETRLTRLEDDTYTDVWRWESPDQMRAAAAGLPHIPEAGAAMALTLRPQHEIPLVRWSHLPVVKRQSGD
jgi:hypothetical protein